MGNICQSMWRSWLNWQVSQRQWFFCRKWRYSTGINVPPTLVCPMGTKVESSSFALLLLLHWYQWLPRELWRAIGSRSINSKEPGLEFATAPFFYSDNAASTFKKSLIIAEARCNKCLGFLKLQCWKIPTLDKDKDGAYAHHPFSFLFLISYCFFKD